MSEFRAFLDWHRRVPTAKIVRKAFSDADGGLGIETRRHINEQNILLANRLHVESRRKCGVNAARCTDNNSLQVALRHIVAYAVNQSLVNVVDFGGLHQLRRIDGGEIAVNILKINIFLGVHTAVRNEFALGVPHRRTSVKTEDGLAIVLETETVDVNHRLAEFARVRRKMADAALIFAGGKGGLRKLLLRT